MNRERAEGRFLRPAPWVCDNPMRRRQIVTMSTRFAVVLGAGLGMLCASLAGVPEASAQAAALKVDSGDTAWVLMSSALVLVMLVPGLALFYGGLVRSKNVLGTIMQSFIILSVVSLLWILIGYSLAFGPDKGGMIGGLEWVGLSGVGVEPHPVYGPTVPHQAFMFFQMMFAAITPALIAGAFAERKRFSAMVLFSALWSLFVYVPLAHWIWGGGWLAKLGALDFAGGAVVHISSGISALVLALMLGMMADQGFDKNCPAGTTPKVAAVINWFGVTDVNDVIDGPHKADAALRWFGNMALPEAMALAKKLSPINYVRNGLPPILTIQGDADKTVP